MAFWGVELKPGNPHKHIYDEARGRLHISQATLGSGQSTKKNVVVQCNVGNKSPVLLCSLLPEKTESCPLNLEFAEYDEVIFSVIGQRSVHLTGFYLGSSHNLDRHGDDSDSYGEDIAESETDHSTDYDTEDEYEDDFIDDGDIEMFPLSPRPNSGVTIEEIVDDEKPANKSGTTKRLRKKYQLSDSDSSDDSQKQIVVKGSRISVLESEDEDGFPISTLSKSKCIVKSADSEDKSAKITSEDGMKEKKGKDDSSQDACLKRKIDAINQEGECDSMRANKLSDSFAPSGDVAAENDGKSKKKKKEKGKKEKFVHTKEMDGGDQAIGGSKNDALNNLKTGVEEETIFNIDQDLPVMDELKEKLSNDKEVADSTVPLNTIALESNGKLKKKKKGKAKDKTPQSDDPSAEMEGKVCSDDGSKPPNTKKATIEAKDQDHTQQSNAKLMDNKSLDHNVNPAGADGQNEGKKKKKQQKSKTQKCDASSGREEPQLAMEEAENKLIEKTDEQKTQVRPSKPRTFSNGLVIEELSMGKPDGKKASPGNKVFVYYIGKLKKNGEIFDSNIGRKPFKFRLGIGEVIKGWDVGVAGMRIGDKRRLTIPPSMGYGTKGAGKIPANAWLVFDVELVDVQ